MLQTVLDSLILSLESLQVPSKHLLKDTLSTSLNHIPMTRDNPIKVPRSNMCHTLIKVWAITSRQSPPNDPLLPHRRTPSMLQSSKQLRQDPTLWILLRLAKLLSGR